MLSGSNAVPGTTEPAIVTVAAWMPSSWTPAAIRVAAERSAAFPIERLASAGTGWSAKPPLVKSSVPVPAVRKDGRGDLCRDDGADDVDVVCGPEPSDRRVEDLARIRQGSVVHGDARGARGAEDPLERCTVAVQIFDVCAHRLDLKPVATQLRREFLDRFAAGDECAAKAFAAEAPNDAGADAGPGADQQEVTRVNSRGHGPPPGRASPRLSARATVLEVQSPSGR